MTFILSGGSNIDHQITPVRRKVAGLEFTFTLDNSGGQATISFGTFNFPMQGARHPGRVALETRDDSGDSIIWTDTWSAPVEPPWATQNGNIVSGDLFDTGSSVFRSFVKSCVNLGNSSRIVFNAGVPGTFDAVVLCEFRGSTSGTENICPGVQDATPLLTPFTVAIHATMTG